MNTKGKRIFFVIKRIAICTSCTQNDGSPCNDDSEAVNFFLSLLGAKRRGNLRDNSNETTQKHLKSSSFLFSAKVFIRIIMLSVFILSSQALFAAESYKPYIEIGGSRYFGKSSNFADIYDIFIPLLQKENKLFFTDLRMFGRSSGSYEGGAHLGFRKLYPDEKKMFGIYGSFDCKWTDQGDLFKQITIGGEYWSDKWFIGGNIYQPLGEAKKFISKHIEQESRAISITEHYEQALSGVDAELGYSLTKSLTIYGGGYYFYAKGTETTAGPRLRIAYNYNKAQDRILGILDGVGIEVGVQYDKPRGAVAYVGIKLKIGLTDLENNSNVSGFERHMVELVRRDPDIVIGKSKQKFYQSGDRGFQGGCESEATKDFADIELKEALKESLKEFGLPEDATLKDVKKKYRKHSLNNHPDRCSYLYGKDRCLSDGMLQAKMNNKMVYINDLYGFIIKNI